ncbi:MAG: FYDLN acid domain-containing protein [Holosporales bacterium]|jgi:hypothetical protein|nr:FYDLN acid domain-containing protein [Holosporales bacterium]
MKLEWGKKIYCPACALPFYNMQKTSLVCPNCGNKFDILDLVSKKGDNVAMDEVIDLDEKIALSTFGFEEEGDADFIDEGEKLSEKEEIIDDIQLFDEK